MTRFLLPLIAFFAVACDPIELEYNDESDTWDLATTKVAPKVTAGTACFDANGNPINSSNAACAQAHQRVTGSAAPNGGHDPLMMRVNGLDTYIGRGYNNVPALLGGSTRTSTTAAYNARNTNGMLVAVLNPSGNTRPVSRIVWGDLIMGSNGLPDGYLDVMIIHTNGDNYAFNGRTQGSFTGGIRLQ